MAQLQTDITHPMTFERLMRLGQVSHAQGNDRMAHDYWRQAAMLQPDSEEVWTALMWVIDNDEDRKVCLKNILTINPRNIQAQQMLDDLIGDTQSADIPVVPDVSPEPERKLNIVRVIVLGSIFGIGISIIIILLQMLMA